MNRRSALASVSLLALTLAGCQPGATPQQQLQADAALVTAGVAAVAVSVEATPNLDPATKTKIDNALATVVAANGIIQQSTAVPGTAAQQLIAAIRVAAPILLGLLNPASAEAIAINAALALLPTILAAAGVTVAPAPAAKLTMNPATARMVLNKYVHK